MRGTLGQQGPQGDVQRGCELHGFADGDQPTADLDVADGAGQHLVPSCGHLARELSLGDLGLPPELTQAPGKDDVRVPPHG